MEFHSDVNLHFIIINKAEYRSDGRYLTTGQS